MRITADRVADLLRRAAASLPHAVMREERETLRLAQRTAMSFSSGPYSLRELRKMGHPYAQRDPRPPLHPGVINVQTGRFLHAWQPYGPYRIAGGVRGRLINAVEYARYLDRGTKRMIRRPIRGLVLRGLRRQRVRRVRDAVKRAFR